MSTQSSVSFCGHHQTKYVINMRMRFDELPCLVHPNLEQYTSIGNPSG